jgi:hypothetical protein
LPVETADQLPAFLGSVVHQQNFAAHTSFSAAVDRSPNGGGKGVMRNKTRTNGWPPPG